MNFGRSNINLDSIPEKIKTLVENDFYQTTESERSANFQISFFKAVEACMLKMRLLQPPVEYNETTHQFKILNSFKDQANPVAFLDWKGLFLKEYSEFYSQKPAEENNDQNLQPVDSINENEDNPPDAPPNGSIEFLPDMLQLHPDLPDLIYKADDIEYAKQSADKISGIDEEPEMPDPYGWIGNRKREFFLSMGALCDTYMLPRLPILFSPELQFGASKIEIDNFCTLIKERKTRLEIALVKANEIQAKLLSHIKDSTEEATKIILRSNANFAYERVITDEKAEWQKDNINYFFPARVSIYPCELIESFADTRDSQIEKTVAFESVAEHRNDFEPAKNMLFRNRLN